MNHLTAAILLFLLPAITSLPTLRQTPTSTSVFAVCPFPATLDAVARYGKCDACKEAIRDANPSAPTICTNTNCCARTFLGLTSHFYTCYQGCCTRLVTLQAAPDSDTAQVGAVLQMQTIVNNEFTLKNITNGVCFFEDGPNPKCGTRCARQFLDEVLCKGRKSAHVPVWSATMLNPPCSGLYPNVDPPNIPYSATTGTDADTTTTDPGNSHDADTDDADTDDAPENDVDTDQTSTIDTSDASPDDGSTDGDTTSNDSDDAISSPDKADQAFGQPTISGDDEAGTDGSTQEGGSTDDPFGSATAVNSQSSQNDAACFPADAIVTLEAGSHLNMHQLRVGQRVLVGKGVYSNVFAFSHARADGIFQFVRVSTEKGFVVRASPGHFLYANSVIVPARDVRVGDMLVLASGQYDRMTSVRWNESTGLCNPQTVHGDIVVDGVVSTTYTEAIDLGIAHSLMTPLRAIVRVDYVGVIARKVGELIMGLSEIWRQYSKS